MIFSTWRWKARRISDARSSGTQIESWTIPARCLRSRYAAARSRAFICDFRALAASAFNCVSDSVFSSSLMMSLVRNMLRSDLDGSDASVTQEEQHRFVTRDVIHKGNPNVTSDVRITFVDLLHKYKSGLGCSAYPPDLYLFHAPSRGGPPGGPDRGLGVSGASAPRNTLTSSACAFSSGKRRGQILKVRA